MHGPLARVRFGVFLAVAILAGTQLADVAAGTPSGPGVSTRTSLAMAGQVTASSFRVIGAGGFVQSVVYEGTLLCAPCSITIKVLDSSLVVAGGGVIGILPPGEEYTIAAFVGEMSTTKLVGGPFAVSLVGGAEAIRATPEGWE